MPILMEEKHPKSLEKCLGDPATGKTWWNDLLEGGYLLIVLVSAHP
jgi:hypothetical protein